MARARIGSSWPAALAAVALAGCPSEPAPPTAPAPSAVAPLAAPSPSAATSSRPAPPPSAPPTTATPARAAPSIEVPSTIRPGERRPLLVLLHGLGASGKALLEVAPFRALAARRRFSLVAPDGATDSKGRRFWNASGACCDFDKTGTPHVAELRALLESAVESPAVDPKRVFVLGYSNGGFMAHRLACEVPGIAGIVSIAGAGPSEGEPCAPPAPVAVLQIHGDADQVIRYEGGRALGRADLTPHPSALETVSAWAARDGCKGKPAGASAIDLDDKIDGAETLVTRFPGCTRPVELWTVRGAGHFVATHARSLDTIGNFLENQVKP
jgi:polyhydroxybutyrate depolymerase